MKIDTGRLIIFAHLYKKIKVCFNSECYTSVCKWEWQNRKNVA